MRCVWMLLVVLSSAIPAQTPPDSVDALRARVKRAGEMLAAGRKERAVRALRAARAEAFGAPDAARDELYKEIDARIAEADPWQADRASLLRPVVAPLIETARKYVAQRWNASGFQMLQVAANLHPDGEAALGNLGRAVAANARKRLARLLALRVDDAADAIRRADEADDEEAAYLLRIARSRVYGMRSGPEKRALERRIAMMLKKADPLAAERHRATTRAATKVIAVAQRYARTKWFTTARDLLALATVLNTAKGRPALDRMIANLRKHRRAGDAGLEDAIDDALDWLVRHRLPRDGYWDADGFDQQCWGNACEGRGYPTYDPGLTGLVVLVLVGAGQYRDGAPHRAALDAAVAYLRRIQDPEGCFGVQAGHFLYSHAICTFAVAEVYLRTRRASLKAPVEKAVAFLRRGQQVDVREETRLGWRYTLSADDSDTSVTGWAVNALVTAHAAGLSIPRDTLAGAREWIQRMTDPATGRIGYLKAGIGPVRSEDREAQFPREKSEATTASGLVTLILTGSDPADAAVRRSASLLAQKLPTWTQVDGSIDHYYWYFGTRAAARIGGRLWATWSRALRRALADHQRMVGCATGSFDPIGAWGPDGGRVYSTAILTLCLQELVTAR